MCGDICITSYLVEYLKVYKIEARSLYYMGNYLICGEQSFTSNEKVVDHSINGIAKTDYLEKNVNYTSPKQNTKKSRLIVDCTY